MKYLKEFNTVADYEAAESSLILPNVSIVIQPKTIHYTCFKKVEYLESSGVEYIDLNYVPQGDGVEIGGEFSLLGYANANKWVYLYGSYVNEDTNTFRIIRYQDTDNKLLLFNHAKASGGGTTVNIQLGTKYSFAFTDNQLQFGGVNYTSSGLKGNENTSSLYLFGKNVLGARLRFYSFYVKNNGNKVIDLMPVRYEGVGYMYDKISGKLFGNSGSGSFTCGPDV